MDGVGPSVTGCALSVYVFDIDLHVYKFLEKRIVCIEQTGKCVKIFIMYTNHVHVFLRIVAMK